MDIELLKSAWVSIVYPKEVEKWMATDASGYLASPEASMLEKLSGSRRLDWLAGRIAAKKVFATRNGLSPQAVLIDYETSGQPFYIGHEGFCSISHSYGWGAAAFSVKYPIGIDIELSRPHDQSLLDYVAGADELDTISSLDIETDSTTLIWVVKEAIMKAEGVGLTGPRNLYISSVSWHSTMPIVLSVQASSVVFDCQQWSVYVYIIRNAYLAIALPSNAYEKSITNRNRDGRIRLTAKAI